MAIHFELLNRNNLEALRKLRNENREWFIDSKEISFEDQYQWFVDRSKFTNDLIFLIIDNNISYEYIGVISIYNITKDGLANIGRMMIADKFKRKGYMLRSLILMFELAQRFLGIKQLTLEVKSSNVPARELYTKVGFITYGFTKDTIIMRKILQ